MSWEFVGGVTPNEDAYSFSIGLRQIDFSDAVSLTIEALKTEGFGVLTDIDVRERLLRVSQRLAT